MIITRRRLIKTSSALVGASATGMTSLLPQRSYASGGATSGVICAQYDFSDGIQNHFIVSASKTAWPSPPHPPNDFFMNSNQKSQNTQGGNFVPVGYDFSPVTNVFVPPAMRYKYQMGIINPAVLPGYGSVAGCYLGESFAVINGLDLSDGGPPPNASQPYSYKQMIACQFDADATTSTVSPFISSSDTNHGVLISFDFQVPYAAQTTFNGGGNVACYATCDFSLFCLDNTALTLVITARIFENTGGTLAAGLKTDANAVDSGTGNPKGTATLGPDGWGAALSNYLTSSASYVSANIPVTAKTQAAPWGGPNNSITGYQTFKYLVSGANVYNVINGILTSQTINQKTVNSDLKNRTDASRWVLLGWHLNTESVNDCYIPAGFDPTYNGGAAQPANWAIMGYKIRNFTLQYV